MRQGCYNDAMKAEFSTEAKLRSFGSEIGKILDGSETIELIGDVGAGKTTLVKGIVAGLGSDETVQSPTFTINRVYELSGDKRFVHYDFYRLNDAGIMKLELAEALGDAKTMVAIEWADAVDGVLPEDRLTIEISPLGENGRSVELSAGGQRAEAVLERLA